jgi:DNA-directed RNA polymerase subunit RPC12/RpoP
MTVERDIVFYCPHCKAGLRAKEEVATRRVACPKCGESIVVPDKSKVRSETGSQGQ